MISELDLLRVGVFFTREAGRLVPSGPPGTDLRAAVAERAEAVQARLAGGPPHDGGARWGVCDTCGGAMGTLCNGLCCTPSGGRAATLEKRHAACCHETRVDGSRVPGSQTRRQDAHQGSNRSGTCWLCQLAAQKLQRVNSTPQAAVRVVDRPAAAPVALVAAPWEASNWDHEAYCAKLRASQNGKTT